MKNITIEYSSHFNRNIIKSIIQLGGSEIINGINGLNRDFKLNTKAGELHLSIPKKQKFLFIMFSRFKDVEKVNKTFGSDFGHNVHSGKWNFQSNDLTPESLDNTIKYFAKELSLVI